MKDKKFGDSYALKTAPLTRQKSMNYHQMYGRDLESSVFESQKKHELKQDQIKQQKEIFKGLER